MYSKEQRRRSSGFYGSSVLRTSYTFNYILWENFLWKLSFKTQKIILAKWTQKMINESRPLRKSQENWINASSKKLTTIKKYRKRIRTMECGISKTKRVREAQAAKKPECSWGIWKAESTARQLYYISEKLSKAKLKTARPSCSSEVRRERNGINYKKKTNSRSNES